MSRLIWMLALVAAVCCSPRPKEPGTETLLKGLNGRAGEGITRYARGFEVLEGDGYRMLLVHDPWQNSRNVTKPYLLAEDPGRVPDSLRRYPFIRVPVERVITLSTTHVAMIDHLGKAASIAGSSGTRFIYSPAIRERVRSGEIREVGYDQGLNYEAIVGLNPDLVFIYGVETDMQAVSEKLADLKIPVVYCAEYLEKHPLGKAEWIKFFALFYHLDQKADSIFSAVDSSYRALADLVSGHGAAPRILTGLPWKDTWYMAGGKSFAAQLIRDAGGDYLWSENPSDEAIPLDLESVFSRALEADIWINPGIASSLDQLGRADHRFSDLPVYRSGEVYNNDRRISPLGGNDYWESGTIRPDLVLSDLIRVFHPDLLTDHQFTYYRKLK